MDNAEIARTLDAYAALLDLAGAAHWSVRAYRRAADLIRATPAPVEQLVRTGRVRELRGIGPGIERRLRELVETGRIAELEELEREVEPELVALGRYLGLGPQRLVAIGRALGIRSADELRAAAEAGRLRDVPGVGPATEAKVLAALAREPQPARRGLTRNRALALADAIAAPLGAVAAGELRRGCELVHRLVLVSRDADALERFVSQPEVVAVLERDERHAVGVTVDGIPVELVAAAPDALRHRARPGDGYRRVRRGARAPAGRRRRRRTSTSGSASPGSRPSYGSLRFAASPRRSSRSRTSAATSTATRRGPTARPRCSRWRRPRAPAATSTSRSATTRRTCAWCRDSTPTRSGGRPRRSPPRTRSSRRFACCAEPSATSAPTAASTYRTTSSPSSSGCSSRSTPASARPRRS